MTVGTLVGRAVLLVVTSIVAKKTLSGWCSGRSKKHPGQGLSGGQDDPSALWGYLGGGTMKESVFLRESEFRHEGVSRGRRPGRES